ncbi:unnamed protein product [Brassica rapa subsp. narinosa]
MAVSSVTSFILPPSFPNPTSSSSPIRQKLSLLSLYTLLFPFCVSLSDSSICLHKTMLGTHVLQNHYHVPSSSSINVDADKMAPKQKIRIKLRSYWVSLIEDSCKQILDAARNTNAKTMGPVPLPTKKRIYCVLKSPHVHKDARFHFEIRTHQRMIDILYPTAQTIDSLMQLDLPAGVDVEVNL